MGIRLFAFMALAATLSQTSAAGVPPNPSRPPKGLISDADAVALCRDFLKKAGAPEQELGAKTNPAHVERRSAEVVRVTFDKSGTFNVNPTKRRVEYYEHLAPSGTERKHNGPSVRRVATSYDQAKRVLRDLANRLGVPRDYKQLEMFCIIPFVSSEATFSDADVILATFHPTEFGYRIGIVSRYFQLQMDNTTGRLLNYHTFDLPLLPHIVESHVPTLTFEAAKAIADPIAEQRGFRGKGSYGLSNTGNHSELVLVCPNGLFGGIKYAELRLATKDKPARLRLAWEIRYENWAAVWIDAGDGRVLGGREAMLVRG